MRAQNSSTLKLQFLHWIFWFLHYFQRHRDRIPPSFPSKMPSKIVQKSKDPVQKLKFLCWRARRIRGLLWAWYYCEVSFWDISIISRSFCEKIWRAWRPWYPFQVPLRLCKAKVVKFAAAAKWKKIFKLAGIYYGRDFIECLTCWKIVISKFVVLKMAWALRGHHGLSNRERTE